jgi:hypothetical protein
LILTPGVAANQNQWLQTADFVCHRKTAGKAPGPPCDYRRITRSMKTNPRKQKGQSFELA